MEDKNMDRCELCGRIIDDKEYFWNNIPYDYDEETEENLTYNMLCNDCYDFLQQGCTDEELEERKGIYSNTWTIQAYQKYVEEGASPAYTKELAMLGLVGEIGEISDVIKKSNIYTDMSKFEAKYGMSVKDKVKDELGDVLWQYTLVASLYGLTIDEIIEENVRKLNSRHGGAGKVAADGGGERK